MLSSLAGEVAQGADRQVGSGVCAGTALVLEIETRGGCPVPVCCVPRG